MVKIVGIKFKETGKIYYFSPNGLSLNIGDSVIVETQQGIELGNVVLDELEIDEKSLVAPLRRVIRIADDKDMKRIEQNKKKEADAFNIALKKIEENELDMNLVRVEYSFDATKIVFFFTAENRVDFRKLVKDLAAVFRTRIELRQIGVRDKAKMLGGIGICGRPFCCSTFLGDFQSVSIRMAKEQGLSLNPVKLSGACGRLMCCLSYEQNAYEELLSITPKVGATVSTKQGKGFVSEVNLLTGMLKINLSGSDGAPIQVHRDEVQLIKDAKIRVTAEEAGEFKGLE